MNKSYLVTGANAGLGKEAARQLSLKGAEKIYLGCRNPEKARIALNELEKATGKNVFEILLIDVSSMDSVRNAVEKLPQAIDVVILNAGGIGGKTPEKITETGATYVFAANVLGHTYLVDLLIKSKKLKETVFLSGAEAIRGIPMLKMERPKLPNSSKEDFTGIIDGTIFNGKFDTKKAFIYAKYMGTLWMGAMSRKHVEYRFITMSPGGTAGSTMSDAPASMRFMLTYLVQPIFRLLGKYHDMETGAKRYLMGLNDPSYKSGVFYGSEYPGLIGDIVDQSTIFEDIGNEEIQDNALSAIQEFMPK